jgi:tetratricopeptide (TPR) repeat protein
VGPARQRRARLGVVLCGLVLAPAAPAAAGRLTDFSQAEFLTLPRVCLAQRFINEELTSPAVPESERAELTRTLGHSFIHYHHHCWALLYVARAELPGGDKYNYDRAVDNFDYVLRRADPSFVLLPDVYVQKGNVLERTGAGAAAVDAYRNALRANPTYTPAYLALAAHFVAAGDVAAARAAIAEGLKHDPKSKVLKERQAALAKR